MLSLFNSVKLRSNLKQMCGASNWEVTKLTKTWSFCVYVLSLLVIQAIVVNIRAALSQFERFPWSYILKLLHCGKLCTNLKQTSGALESKSMTPRNARSFRFNMLSLQCIKMILHVLQTFVVGFHEALGQFERFP